MTTSETLKKHYSKVSNYKNRINTKHYITRPDSFWEWIAGQYHIPSAARILDIGCGDGEIWEYMGENLHPDVSVTLSDFSQGMLDSIHDKIDSQQYDCHFEYKLADICQLPFSEKTFDMIFCHMMLYHASSINQAINEMKRVLQPNGVVGISTLGIHSCSHIYELVHEIEPRLQPHTYSSPFCIEIAREILPKYFSSIEEKCYSAELKFHEPEPIITFLKSLEMFYPISVGESFYEKCSQRLIKIIDEKQAVTTGFTGSLFLCRM